MKLKDFGGVIKKQKKFLKWRPQYAGIKDFKKAIFETIKWYKIPQNLKKFDLKQFNI